MTDTLAIKIPTPVLIIESDETVSDKIRLSLMETPDQMFSVTVAPDAKSGSDALEKDGYGCVLLSRSLPDRNGLEFLKSLKKTKNSENLPVVMLLADEEMKDTMAALLTGASDCLMKNDLKPDVVLRTILYSIEKSRAGAASRRYRKFIETLVDTIPYPLYYKDADDTIIGCNAAFEGMLNKSGSEILGKRDFDLFSLSAGTPYFTKKGESPAGADALGQESTLIGAGGEKYDVLCNRGYFSGDDGSVDGSVCVMADITRIKTIERELRTFRSVVEQSPASIIITGVDGVIEYVNPKFSEVTGYSPEEAVGRKPSILKSGKHDNEFYRELWRKIQGGKNWKGEFHNARKNGELFWELASISPILDDQGVPRHFIAVKEDITYLKKMEEEIRESDEKLQVLFESLNEGIAVTDLKGKILQANPAFTSQHNGILGGDPVGADIKDIFKDKTRLSLAASMEKARRRGQSDIVEYSITGPAGERMDSEMSISLLKDREKRPWGYVIATKDMSERKLAELALRESEERNREILEAIPDMMFKINSQGKCLEPALVSRVLKVFPESVTEKVLPVIRETLDTGEIRIYEYPLYSRGDLQYYEARFIVSGADEVLVILRKITDRFITDEQLKKARDDAEAANRAKSEFLAHMSHEIRTPLNSILGFIELLQRSRLDPVQSEYLDIVSTSARNLLGIINDVLDFSKIESRKLDIDEVPFDPVREFESVINLFTVKSNQKNIALHTYIDPRLPYRIVGDPLRIKQVLTNLLSNAIKFTPVRGTIKLEITVDAMAAKKCGVHFAVKDDGIGIDENKQKKIFDAFSQADSSIARKYGGTGLGLSISANLLKLMKSELNLQSEKGKGSNFHFTIEFPIAEKERVDLRGVRTDRINIAFFPRGGESKEMEDYLIKYLFTFGFRVFRITHLDDLDMSQADFAVTAYTADTPEAWYRDIGETRSLPIIIVAQEKDRFEIEPYRKYVSKVITNPINPSKLYNTIMDLMLDVPDDIDTRYRPAAGQRQYAYDVKALVAEDNAINQKLFSLMLKEFGIESTIARNGLEAIEKFQTGGWDVVLMDINMPIYTGVEAAEIIREYEQKNGIPHVPMIALTAKAMKGDRESLLESGFDDYLSKPLALEELQRMLEKYFSFKKKSPENAPPAGAGDADRGKLTPRYSIEDVGKSLGLPGDTIKSILREFFVASENYTREIMDAIRDGDMNRINLSAHKLKGIAANLHMVEVAALSRTIEENAESGSGYDYFSALDEIIETISRLRHELEPQLE